MHHSINRVLLIIGLFVTIAACTPSFEVISTTVENQTITADNSLTDSAIVRFYLPYKKQLDEEMNKVIGYAPTDLFKAKPESKLTNLLADLLLEETRSILSGAGRKPIAHLAFLNYGGIRTGIPEGPVTVNKMFELMPFENELVVLELSGADVKRFLDLIASRGGESISGVRFRIRDGKAADIKIDGKSLASGGTYWLATSDYVADGGDSYAMLMNSTDRINTGIKIRDVIIQYLERIHAAGKKLNPETDGRIINE
jgi:2',3'-cyclic-nucleotide 2'-phosphodiesterase (5'-nucleotidase family)